MNLVEQNICPNCGGKMNNKDSRYDCLYCGKSYREENIAEKLEDVKKHLKGIVTDALVEQRLSDIANARRNLYQAIHEEYTDNNKVKEYSRKLKEYLPDDVQANFYESAVSSNAKNINKYIDNINTEEYDYLAGDIIEFMIKSLEKSNILPLKNLADKVYRLNDHDKFLEYTTRIESEAEKIDKGIYKTDLPRKVFVAYSSADIEKVNEITEYLEENGISCFVAARNLRHGKGAVENYKKNLETAMRNCKCLVFVSSENSRSLECDAIDVELPYIKENLPRMGRIEYIAEEYGNTPTAVKNYLKDFFKGLEYCRTKEDLVKRILDAPVTEKTDKYCVKCGSKNPLNVKFCGECAGNIFVDTFEQALKIKTENELKSKLEQEYKAKLEAIEKEYKAKLEAELKSKLEIDKQKSAALENKAALASAIDAVARKASTERETKIRSFVERKDDLNVSGDFEIVGNVLKKYRGNGERVIVPEGVKEIGGYAFYGCGDLKYVELPDSLSSIGNYAFYGCCNLTVVGGHFDGGSGHTKLPCNLRTIGSYAFYGCKQLNSIYIPENVYGIGGYAFYDCPKLTVYCYAANKLAGWDEMWAGGSNVVWKNG